MQKAVCDIEDLLCFRVRKFRSPSETPAITVYRKVYIHIRRACVACCVVWLPLVKNAMAAHENYLKAWFQ